MFLAAVPDVAIRRAMHPWLVELKEADHRAGGERQRPDATTFCCQLREALGIGMAGPGQTVMTHEGRPSPIDESSLFLSPRVYVVGFAVVSPVGSRDRGMRGSRKDSLCG